MSKLVIVGSVAFDAIETPFGKTDKILGGAATYIGLSASHFNVDATLGPNGVCDFLISSSAEQLAVEAPAVVIVESKKADLNSGIDQCIA